MAQWKTIGGSAVLAALLSGAAASADVTAEEVWQSWIDYYADLGQTVTTGGESRQGDTLIVTDAAFSAEMPDGSYSATIPEVRLQERGDGTVEVTFSPEIPMVMTTRPETGETVDMAMTFTHSGMSTVVSGTPEDMNYDITAAEMRFGIGGMEVDDETIDMKVDVALKNSAATYRVTDSGPRAVTSTFTAESADFDVSGTDPEGGGGTFAFTGSFTGLEGDSSMAIPEGIDMADMAAALKAGLKMEGSFAYGGGAYTADIQDAADSMNISGTGEGGSLDFAMSQDAMRYGATGSAQQMTLAGAALPFPVEIGMAESAFNFLMPLSQGEEAKPFQALFKMVDFTVSDEVWGMFDPMASLPRDPATLVIDLAGQARMLADIFDPAAMDSPAPPAELHALDVNALQLKAAGAELTGQGGFTFDNSDMSLGYPRPLGALDLRLVGANALLDKLVAMGFVPEDQAMGARMMMGLFAVPDGEDSLTSKIEFREDGGLYANGQRLQ